MSVVKSVAILALIALQIITQGQMRKAQLQVYEAQRQTREALDAFNTLNQAYNSLKESNDKNYRSAKTCTDSLQSLTVATQRLIAAVR